MNSFRGDRGAGKIFVDMNTVDLNLEPHNKAKGNFQIFREYMKGPILINLVPKVVLKCHAYTNFQ